MRNRRTEGRVSLTHLRREQSCLKRNSYADSWMDAQWLRHARAHERSVCFQIVVVAHLHIASSTVARDILTELDLGKTEARIWGLQAQCTTDVASEVGELDNEFAVRQDIDSATTRCKPSMQRDVRKHQSAEHAEQLEHASAFDDASKLSRRVAHCANEHCPAFWDDDCLVQARERIWRQKDLDAFRIQGRRIETPGNVCRSA